MTAARVALVLLGGCTSACGRAAPPTASSSSTASSTASSSSPAPAPAPAPARPDPRAGLVAITLDTAPGLSGLARADDGALWTVAERAATAYQITLDAANPPRPTVRAVPVDGVPAGRDLEAIAALGGDRFALGVEAQTTGGQAEVLHAALRGGRLLVDQVTTITSAEVGVAITDNRGSEGLCGRGRVVLAAIESVGEDAGGRWSPLVVITEGRVTAVHRLRLTSETGKISGLDCAVDGAAADVLAIERHFAVTRLVRVRVDLAAAGGDLRPTVAVDLAPTLRGEKNLEGVATLADGRVVVVVDNQYKTITGPSELLVLP